MNATHSPQRGRLSISAPFSGIYTTCLRRKNAFDYFEPNPLAHCVCRPCFVIIQCILNLTFKNDQWFGVRWRYFAFWPRFNLPQWTACSAVKTKCNSFLCKGQFTDYQEAEFRNCGFSWIGHIEASPGIISDVFVSSSVQWHLMEYIVGFIVYIGRKTTERLSRMNLYRIDIVLKPPVAFTSPGSTHCCDDALPFALPPPSMLVNTANKAYG